MKLGHGNEIKYDTTAGTITRYIVILDGEPTMRIVCDSADPEKTIRVAPIGGILQDTKGVFTMTETFLEGPDGEPLGVESRVDSKSVYRYAVPRLPSLIGRLLRAVTNNPCADGKCINPAAHAEGAHDL